LTHVRKVCANVSRLFTILIGYIFTKIITQAHARASSSGDFETTEKKRRA